MPVALARSRLSQTSKTTANAVDEHRAQRAGAEPPDSKIEEYVARCVSLAPPLSADQRARLSVLLRVDPLAPLGSAHQVRYDEADVLAGLAEQRDGSTRTAR